MCVYWNLSACMEGFLAIDYKCFLHVFFYWFSLCTSDRSKRRDFFYVNCWLACPFYLFYLYDEITLASMHAYYTPLEARCSFSTFEFFPQIMRSLSRASRHLDSFNLRGTDTDVTIRYVLLNEVAALHVIILKFALQNTWAVPCDHTHALKHKQYFIMLLCGLLMMLLWLRLLYLIDVS